MNVFTYGTLMIPEVWLAVVGREFETAEGILPNYQIFRVRGAVFPGITAALAGESVRGVMYLEVDSASIARLDRFEDDFYERRSLNIDCDDGERRTADAYVVPPANRHVLTNEPWQRDAFIESGGLDQFIARFAGFGRVAGGD